MNLLDFADYGVAIFAIACIAYIVYIFKSSDTKMKTANEYAKEYRQLLATNQEIMKLNTEVINNNTKAITELITFLKVSDVEIKAKLDELIRR
jgi:hypothetical protein